MKKQINSEFLAEKQQKWPYIRCLQGVANTLSFFQEFLIYFCPDFDIGCFKAVGSEQYSMRWLLFDFSIRCGFRKQLVA